MNEERLAEKLAAIAAGPPPHLIAPGPFSAVELAELEKRWRADAGRIFPMGEPMEVKMFPGPGGKLYPREVPARHPGKLVGGGSLPSKPPRAPAEHGNEPAHPLSDPHPRRRMVHPETGGSCIAESIPARRRLEAKGWIEDPKARAQDGWIAPLDGKATWQRATQRPAPRRKRPPWPDRHPRLWRCARWLAGEAAGRRWALRILQKHAQPEKRWGRPTKSGGGR